MQQLLETVRKASLPGIWSQGVKLAREGAVALAVDRDGRARRSACARRGTRSRPRSPCTSTDASGRATATGKVDPCTHVAAAAIAAAQAAEKGEPLAARRAEAKPPRLVYRLGAQGPAAHASPASVVHGDGREERLARVARLRARARVAPSRGSTPTHEDLRVDRILGSPPREVVPLGAASADLFEALSADAEVTLDGARRAASRASRAAARARRDAPGGGFVLRLERDPAITEVVVAQGVVRVRRRAAPARRDGDDGRAPRAAAARARRSARSDAAELVTKVLPELEAKLDVVVATTRLPRKAADARPRIAMDLSHQGHTLSVLPTLVYGDPPVARVDGDALVAARRRGARAAPRRGARARSGACATS